MARKGENIFHRKDGRWEARYVKGYNIDGSYKYGYVYGKTYLEVKTRRIAILMELEKQEKKKDGFVRFNDRIDEWLKRQKVSVKLSTYSYYINVVERHIRPLLGNMLLKNINSVCITDFINVKNEENNLKDSTLKEIMIVLKQILSFCDINISIKLPRVSKKKIAILSNEEKERLETYIYCNLNNYTVGILLSLYAGLRIGEVCALRWSDIDFEKKILSIKNTIVRVKNLDKDKQSKTLLMLTDAKTTNSVRIIPLNSNLIKILREFKGDVDNDFYILSSKRFFVDPRTYYNQFKNVLKKCNITNYNYHSLRHTFATKCIELGLDPKSLSEILGHSDIKTTLSLYVHPNLETKRSFMDSKFMCPFYSPSKS